MENEVIDTLKQGERVTSTYAEIYFDDNYCDDIDKSVIDENHKLKELICKDEKEDSLWISPSDLLIGILELQPPFTSKITRGKTHEGILAIGDEVLAVERAKFLKHITKLIHENDSAWNHILLHERASVDMKVKEIYSKIFIDKSQIMSREISLFYENTLQELEANLKLQVENTLIPTHAQIISKLNTEIKEILHKEKKVLQEVLKKRYDSEVFKMKKYYRLLLNNEKHRSNKLIDKALTGRNDALKAFIKQIEAEKLTSTMYILCTERKKCRIKQFILENYHSLELKEKYQKIKERQELIDIFKEREVQISEINKDWEDKIKKILHLFLKFISFSLKLLPEQTSFLLDFEKMVVLQLNEMQKTPWKTTSILVDTEDVVNTFKFQQIGVEKEECTKEPFIIEGGHLLGTPVTSYGSSTTLPDDVDLPTVRIQREFVYAKCHHYEEIKAMLEAERCKCSDIVMKPTKSKVSVPDQPQKIKEQVSEASINNESIYEPLLLDDINRFNECPGRSCQNWAERSSFPYLNDYIDFDDEKYKRVLALLEKPPGKSIAPKLIDPKRIVFQELPFSETKEPYHNVETQYSSQEHISDVGFECTCVDNYIVQKKPSSYRLTESPSKFLNEKIYKRKISMTRMLQKNPSLLKIFSDESFDFIY